MWSAWALGLSLWIGLSFGIAFIPLWDERRQLLIVGTLDSVLGSLLLVAPDFESLARRIWTTASRRVELVIAKILVLGRDAVNKVIGLYGNARHLLTNVVLTLLGKPRKPRVRALQGTVKGRSRVSGNLSVIKGGSVKDRLERLESAIDEMRADIASLPQRWRADMENVKERLVMVRFSGVPLTVIGLAFLMLASW